MSTWHIALMIGASIAAVINYTQPRAIYWILIGAMNFAACVLYYDYGLPYPAAFAALLDVGFVLLLYFKGRYFWETTLLRSLFLLSIVLNWLRLTELVASQRLYAMALEGVNWLALLVIGGVGILTLVDHYEIPTSGYFGRFIRSAHKFCTERRKTAPFTQATW